LLQFPSIKSMTARDFELCVKAWLESVEEGLTNFSTSHLEKISGQDGDYTFDVTAQFRIVGGLEIKVLVECKKHSQPIKRELVQVLNDKKRSVGAHKAMLVATAPFQSGAIEFAAKNGIALVQVISGAAIYIRASVERVSPPLEHLEKTIREEPFVGLFYGSNLKGCLIFPQLLSKRRSYELERFLDE
jgi:restriction system protein